ncbi:MAG: alanine dehydrogenase, partial [Zoogloea sp.]|nr:alanine dehydrogenase [Zoogloea sp.]
MKIGVPKETKNHEYRVGLTPGAVREVVSHGHGVIVESGAGLGIGASDADYQQAGAELAGSAEAVFDAAEMIVKVKEPLPEESARLRPDHLLLTYLHLAANPALADELLERKITAIAYETVTAPGGGLPLLAPMSEVAGRMSIQAGAAALEKSRGGRGVLLGGVPGVEPGRVLVLGGGTVGNNAAHTAVGIGADVTVIDKSLAVLRHLDEIYGGRVKTLYATRDDIERLLMQADLVIGAVLIPGATAPKLVTRDMLARMKPGAVIVDVAIDQGGCFETSRPTTHADPTFVVDGVVHYCVA